VGASEGGSCSRLARQLMRVMSEHGHDALRRRPCSHAYPSASSLERRRASESVLEVHGAWSLTGSWSAGAVAASHHHSHAAVAWYRKLVPALGVREGL
jgi:hypothetical protein